MLKYLTDQYVIRPATEPPFIVGSFDDNSRLTYGVLNFLRVYRSAPESGQAEQDDQNMKNNGYSLGLDHLIPKISCSKVVVNRLATLSGPCYTTDQFLVSKDY